MRPVVTGLILAASLAFAGTAAAQVTPNGGSAQWPDQGSALARAKEKMQPTLDLLNRQDANMRLRAYSPEELREIEEQTSDVLSRTGTACEVVESVRVGQTIRRRDVFEVACANGYGYLLTNGPTPAAYDCWTIAQVGLAIRREDPHADVGSQCGLDRNGGDQIAELLPRANRAR